MIPPRWTIGCVALVGLASGCSDGPAPEPRLYPILNERGLITYTYQEPQGQTIISRGARFGDPAPVAEAQPDRPDPQAVLAERREREAAQAEQARRERQELEARDEAIHKQQLNVMIWQRQQARDAMNAASDRRRGRLRGSRSVDDSEADQLRATSLHLSREADRLRQEQRSLRPGGAVDNGIDNRPFPITIP